MPPAVLLLHRDPVVHQLVTAAFADELQVLSALSLDEARAAAAERRVAVAIVDAETAAGSAEALVGELRARDPHTRAIFFADGGRRPESAWRLADLGTVLPRAHDLERLRVAVRREVRAWQTVAGTPETDPRDDKTTRRLPRDRAEASTERLSYFGPSEGPPPGEESTPEAGRG